MKGLKNSEWILRATFRDSKTWLVSDKSSKGKSLTCSGRLWGSRPIDKADGVESAKAGRHIAIGQWRDRVGMGKLIATLARTDRIIFDLHVAVRVPLPGHLPVGADFIDAVAVRTAIRQWRVGEAAAHTPLDELCAEVGEGMKG